MEAVENCCNKFISDPNPVIAVSYVKLLIMELWTIRELLICLNININDFDRLTPRLKEFRDSYAHLKERVQGFEEPKRRQKVEIKREFRTLANEALKSNDGQSWHGLSSCKRIFNLDNATGMMVIFGIVNDFLICNTSTDILELEVSKDLHSKLINIVNKACTSQ